MSYMNYIPYIVAKEVMDDQEEPVRERGQIVQKDPRNDRKQKKRGRVARRRHCKAQDAHVGATDRQWALPSVLRRRREYQLQLHHGLQSESTLTLSPLPEVLGSKMRVSIGVSQVMQSTSNGHCVSGNESEVFGLPGDVETLQRQLGFVPGNAVTVATRLHHLTHSNRYPHLARLLTQHVTDSRGLVDQTPVVLMLYPLALRAQHQGGKVKGLKCKARKRSSLVPSSHVAAVVEPFPTIYWLTHPVLKNLISQLEVGEKPYNVSGMQQRLISNTLYLEQMKRAHSNYSQERMTLITEQDWENIIAPRKWNSALGHDRGVAGISKPETIKCLHAHVAHYLASFSSTLLNQQRIGIDPDTSTTSEASNGSPNLVGQWTMEALEDLAQQMLL